MSGARPTTAAAPRIEPATAPRVAEAARLVAAGGLVAIPTETVYGLAADAESDAAVAAIFAAKDRPHFNPLIVHVAGAARPGSTGPARSAR